MENSQVRMISGPCGRRSIGKVRANRSGSSSQPQAICGVSEDVAQVSMTSGSPTKPPGWPRWDSSNPGGVSLCGSIGSALVGAADRLVPDRGSPASSSGYQTGNGTPK